MNTNVEAMRKILKSPLVCSALLSTALFHFEGREISNPPKKEAAKTISKTKRKILNMAFVDNAFRAFPPNNKVITIPNVT